MPAVTKILNGLSTQHDHFRHCRHIWSYKIRLQAYMVPIVSDIAGIFGSQRNRYCRLICSLPGLILQAYLVNPLPRYMVLNQNIYGPKIILDFKSEIYMVQIRDIK